MADFKRDSRGIAEILKSASMRAAANAEAQEIAGNVRAQLPGANVTTEQETTDRARVLVIVKDRRALGLQARDGLLTRAAAAAGLEVVSYQ